MASVKVESHATFGNVLVATRQFQPGEAVVHERPLLHVPQLKPSNPLYKPLQVHTGPEGILCQLAGPRQAQPTASTYPSQLHILPPLACPPTVHCCNASHWQQPLHSCNTAAPCAANSRHHALPVRPTLPHAHLRYSCPCPQTYFEQHHIPASVVLKMMAFVMASPTTQASVLRCFCPDTTACADTAVVQQARAFASCLLQHPPVPEFAEWADSHGSEQAAATTPSGQAAAPGAAQNPAAFDMLVRVWLIWVMNGHNFKLGSALFDYGSKLTHTCAGPNTMYRTATGQIAAVVETVDGTSSTSGGGLRQQQPAGGAAGDASSPAGMHIALTPIAAGDLLTTNYLGMGHKRLMSTPARQKHLQDKFLFKCTCPRCAVQHCRCWAALVLCPAVLIALMCWVRWVEAIHLINSDWDRTPCC